MSNSFGESDFKKIINNNCHRKFNKIRKDYTKKKHDISEEINRPKKINSNIHNISPIEKHYITESNNNPYLNILNNEIKERPEKDFKIHIKNETNEHYDYYKYFENAFKNDDNDKVDAINSSKNRNAKSQNKMNDSSFAFRKTINGQIQKINEENLIKDKEIKLLKGELESIKQYLGNQKSGHLVNLSVNDNSEKKLINEYHQLCQDYNKILISNNSLIVGKRKLIEENIQLKNENAKLNFDFHFIKIQKDKLKEDFDKINEKYNKLIQDYKQIKNENIDLKEKNLKIEKDYDELKKSPNLLTDEEYDTLYEGFEELQKENEKLKKFLDENKNSKKNNNNFINLEIKRQINIEIIKQHNIQNFENKKNIKRYKTPGDFEEKSKEEKNIIYRTPEFEDNKDEIKNNKNPDEERNKVKNRNEKMRENNLNDDNKIFVENGNNSIYSTMNDNKGNEDYNKLMNDLLDKNAQLINNIQHDDYDLYKLKKEYNNLNEEYNKLKKEINKEKNNNSKNENRARDILKITIRNFSKRKNEQKKHFYSNLNINYFFPNKEFCGIDSTFYMNSIIQCLVHISELGIYFLNEYPDDSLTLRKRNINSESRGEVSLALYNIIKYLYENKDNEINLIPINTRQKYKNRKSLKENKILLEDFKNAISTNNTQFKEFEKNNCNNFIKYLLEVMHEELNYLGGSNYNPQYQNGQNDSERLYLFKNYIINYYRCNYSIFSKMFFGIFEEEIKCNSCKNIVYKYKQFEFLSFDIRQYDKKEFNIYNGFDDNAKIQLLSDNNRIYCNKCNKVYDVEYSCKIIEPPSKLFININFCENSQNIPSKMKFDEEIDITKYVNFHFGFPIKYRIICVCSFSKGSENKDNYIAYCRNIKNDNWYKFWDSSFSECEKSDIHSGNPYLLLYEKL